MKIEKDDIPFIIKASGESAEIRFLTFFSAHLYNPNTQRAYFTATSQFFHWCHSQSLQLPQISPIHIAQYLERLKHHSSPSTVKQHLASIRVLFDWLMMGQIINQNPAKSVRGPKHIVKRGKTPVLSATDTRTLLDSIPTDSIIGRRDRALIALMVFTFARINAALQMQVRDYYPNGKRWWVRLHEKGGKYHEMPAHHTLENYLDDYLVLANIRDEPDSPLFRTFRGKRMTGNAMVQTYAWQMIQRRAKAAGIFAPLCNHSFRGTGITTYLQNGGTLEQAQQMAAHESPRTTKLYDRTQDNITLDEIEKIII